MSINRKICGHLSS